MNWLILRPKGRRNAPPRIVGGLSFFRPGARKAVPFEDLTEATPEELPKGAGAGWRHGLVRFAELGAWQAGWAPSKGWQGGSLVRRRPDGVQIRYFPGYRDPRGWTGADLVPVTPEAWRAIRVFKPELPELKTAEAISVFLASQEMA